MNGRFTSLIIFTLLLGFGGLLAQSDVLKVNAQPIPDSKSDLELVFDLNLPSAPSNGLVIELPEEVMAIPVSVQINGKQMWLQNLTSVPKRDSVIAWQIIPKGLMLLFKEGLVGAGTNLRVTCITSTLKSTRTPREVKIKNIISQSDGIKVSNQTMATGIIPSMTNR